MRQLATKIWNVEAGRVDRYPGTLDEYLEKFGDGSPSKAKKPTASAELGVEAAPVNGATLPVADVAAAGESRADKKARKREEAQRRSEANKKLGPIKKTLADLEARIEALEKDQRERNLALADPETYGDASKRNALLTAYQRDEDELAELGDRWERATEALEELEAQL